MEQNTTNDKIMMVNAQGIVLGASAACAEFLGQGLEQLNGIYILDLNFGLTLTQFLAYFEKIKKDHHFVFKTYFTNQANHMIHIDVRGIYVDSQELALLHINPGVPEEAKNYFSDPKQLLMEFPTTAVELSLGDVMDATLFQNIMDYFYELTGIPVGIIDMNGNIIVKEGWQEICVNFHRVNPASCKNCLESDFEITRGIAVGEYRGYKCKNNLWDIATPIYLGNQRMGHIFLGQFFYTDEPIDYDFFRNQAIEFGFDEEAYMAALDQVPRFSHRQVEIAMKFYTKMASYVSQLSFTNIKIQETMIELYNVMNFQNALMDAVPSPIFYKNKDLVYLGGNKTFEEAIGLAPSDYIGKTVFDISPRELAEAYHQADVELLKTKTPQVYDFQIESLTGENKSVIFNKAIFTDQAGEVAGIIGVIQDITEMKQAQEYLQKVNEEIIDTQKEVIYTLGEIIETRSQEAAKHVVRVAEYSHLIGLMYGLNQEDAMLLKIAAPMHDIGKIGIPDHILNKPGPLTREEFDCIKTHTTIGYNIMKKSNHKILKIAGLIALSHHERWDGTGYPQGITGNQINVFSRIVSVADVFDAISHKRCYKEAWPLDQVQNYLVEQSGQMFDPRVITLFLDNWEEILKIRSENSDAN